MEGGCEVHISSRGGKEGGSWGGKKGVLRWRRGEMERKWEYTIVEALYPVLSVRVVSLLTLCDSQLAPEKKYSTSYAVAF